MRTLAEPLVTGLLRTLSVAVRRTRTWYSLPDGHMADILPRCAEAREMPPDGVTSADRLADRFVAYRRLAACCSRLDGDGGPGQGRLVPGTWVQHCWQPTRARRVLDEGHASTALRAPLICW
jgi:hypothetical protein